MYRKHHLQKHNPIKIHNCARYNAATSTNARIVPRSSIFSSIARRVSANASSSVSLFSCTIFPVGGNEWKCNAYNLLLSTRF